MKKSLLHTSATGLLVTAFILASAVAVAEPAPDLVEDSLKRRSLTEVQTYLSQNPKGVDEVIKSLLRRTQTRLSADPEFSAKMLALAGQYAPQITPPSVPVICADLRRIVESLPESQRGTVLHEILVNTSQNFANAPVVVAAGRPNLCEDAWLQASNLDGEALLAQQPGMRGPGLPPVTIEPGIPPSEQPPGEKPSAD